MYSFNGKLVGEAALGELTGVVTEVVNLYVTGAGFETGAGVGDVACVVIAGMERGFRSVTYAYGCRLRKGLFSLGSGVVDTFRACFFFFLLLCVTHRFAPAIDC